jgi:hypothetical protein
MDEQLQAALEAIDRAVGGPTEQTALVRAKCRGLMAGYHAAWRDSGLVATSVETMLTAPLVNPATGVSSRSFTLAGKLDATVLLDGCRHYVVDHKTTSQPIDDPNAPYWRQLAVEGQATHYLLLAWLNGQKYDGAIWDVVRKPAISPKKLTKAERANVVSSRQYYGRQVALGDLERLQVEERESPEMYESRLAADCLERPDWYFQRRSVPRLDHELEEYAGELWDIAQDLVQVRRTGKHYRNSGACLLYGSPCQFLGICSGHDAPDSDRWKRRERVHEELPLLEGDGRDVLTNSRLRCFQTCRRKEHFQYTLGIERFDAEEREALYFGTIWHAGQEAWWSCFLLSEESCHGNAAADSRTNEVRQSVAAPQLAR